jgi:hypothetical protein
LEYQRDRCALCRQLLIGAFPDEISHNTRAAKGLTESPEPALVLDSGAMEHRLP